MTSKQEGLEKENEREIKVCAVCGSERKLNWEKQVFVVFSVRAWLQGKYYNERRGKDLKENYLFGRNLILKRLYC